MLTVIVPTLNAQAHLPRLLAVLQSAGDTAGMGEIIVADGGSAPAPGPFRPPVKVIASSPGRGRQLAAGAASASGDWMLFVHADTVPGDGWAQAVRTHIDTQPRKAAVFRFALDEDTAAARRLEAVVRWRCRLLALPYGDQGLLISRKLYDEVGGYADMPLMEDVHLIRRIGRARLAFLDVPAMTSAERYRREGYLARMARNFACLSLYFLGVPPRTIARFYA